MTAHGCAAAQSQNLDVWQAARQASNFLRNLISEFPRWAKNQCLNPKRIDLQIVQHGEAERGGLAATGFGPRHYVRACQQLGQGLRLHQRHLQVVDVSEVAEQFGPQRETAEFICTGHGREYTH